ncbi:MAG: Re/Si-specific NAD(P)(+) transhydrogenase subunit alpha [Acidimicrobiia bacterium]
MRISITSEAPGERRVALTPQAAQKLVTQGHQVLVTIGAGDRAGFTDGEYAEAGAQVVADSTSDTDVIMVVGPPGVEAVRAFPVGSVLIGLIEPFDSPDLVRALNERRISSFAMEAIPRSTLAQSMDALSSQATAAGYEAVLVAATSTPRFFPMLTTAAGTIPPVKLLVLGAGVAGLQAIATSRRLGAVVSAYDIRPEVREQIESLGARFVAAPVDESAAAASGYAKEVADETQRRQMQALAPHVAASDVVITTAQIPGHPAPLLVSREMVGQMKPGSVIVDVAAPTGGNCELTVPGETVVHNGVSIIGPIDLAGRVAVDASQMYSRNVTALLDRLTDDDGEPAIDLDDEITSGACITHDGRVVHPVVRRSLGLEGEV